MGNPENLERPNRSETSPPKRDRTDTAKQIGKAAVDATKKKN